VNWRVRQGETKKTSLEFYRFQNTNVPIYQEIREIHTSLIIVQASIRLMALSQGEVADVRRQAWLAVSVFIRLVVVGGS